MLGVQVGEELGLPPLRLRSLATGGLLHDIGKLAVPDSILKKPGALDDDGAVLLSREIAREIEQQLEYPGQIKVTVIRESRATNYAR